MNYLRDLENAISTAVDKLSDVESEFTYVESEYKTMEEKLEDIDSILDEDYSADEKLSRIKEILEK